MILNFYDKLEKTFIVFILEMTMKIKKSLKFNGKLTKINQY